MDNKSKLNESVRSGHDRHLVACPPRWAGHACSDSIVILDFDFLNSPLLLVANPLDFIIIIH
jgi:hypothetical protein